MSIVDWHRRVISSSSFTTLPARVLLRLAEIPYAMAVDRRNRRFDRGINVESVSIPVISVGNLTVGGTGKTPLIIDLCRRLGEASKRVAVVARGYGAQPGQPNDEEQLIRLRYKDVIYVADSDRVRAARSIELTRQADVILLDDGFQHRRLSRVADIVTIDATCPFGFGHLLPLGLLREPQRSMARANLIVLTRCDQVSDDVRTALEREIRRCNASVPIVRARHKVLGFRRLDGSPFHADSSTRAYLFAGIGNPESFLRLAQASGAHVIGTRWFLDHYVYTPADVHRMMEHWKPCANDVLLTTEKDAVKLRHHAELHTSPIVWLEMAIDFADDDDRILGEFVSSLLSS